jgi:hypothetical protein
VKTVRISLGAVVMLAGLTVMLAFALAIAVTAGVEVGHQLTR